MEVGTRLSTCLVKQFLIKRTYNPIQAHVSSGNFFLAMKLFACAGSKQPIQHFQSLHSTAEVRSGGEDATSLQCWTFGFTQETMQLKRRSLGALLAIEIDHFSTVYMAAITDRIQCGQGKERGRQRAVFVNKCYSWRQPVNESGGDDRPRSHFMQARYSAELKLSQARVACGNTCAGIMQESDNRVTP